MISPQTESVSRSKPYFILPALVGSMCLIVGWYWVDPGVPKNGKILVDEHYSRWEWSENILGTRLYGVKTVYSYDNMVEAFKHYWQVERNFDEIDDARLQGVSVLVLKTPTAPYSPKARQAIWRFVEKGGGIWLIGDHTDVFGMDTYLNMIADHYNLGFDFDAAIDPVSNRQLMTSSAFSHPIVRRLPLFLWYTSNSLRSTWFSNDVVLTPRLLEDNPDYSQNTFFGNFSPDIDERIGPVIQAVAVPSARGRIALWSDSTVFSNFAVFLPGKMELAVATID